MSATPIGRLVAHLKRRVASIDPRPFHPDGPTLLELAEQALSSTEHGYDLLASKFDHTPFRTPNRFIEQSMEGVPPGHAALDLCCGTGAALAILAPRFERVVGIDRSAGMLGEAKRRVPNAELIRGDALAPPSHLHGQLDVVTCYGAFGHIPESDEERLCDAVYACLRPGGSFVFLTSTLPPPTSPAWWVARGFNAAMRLRNALIRPPFVMYYLTFLLPRARRLLEARGFEVQARELPEVPRLYAVVATKR